MPVTFAFQHLDHSKSLMNFTEKKIKHLIQKYVSKPVAVHVTFSRRRESRIAHCEVYGGYGFKLSAGAADKTIYAAVKDMVKKLRRQLVREKELVKDHKVHVPTFRMHDGDVVQHHNLRFTESAPLKPVPI